MVVYKYPENTSDYLLPIFKSPGLSERSTYRKDGYNINHNLKRIAEKAGIGISLTLQIYLASLDTSVMDKANSIIIKSL